ncbi:hypothetical protein KUM39_09585 [Streptomyces sp. J2-1]|uniref:SCO3374 family protein n=1 Tax=Streptomyces corallincola TaxID=2851888 RepID=UPI001C3888C0|nr:SCO3374 family protein [Streptomyces corallincola]MBV2354610.1 hypothetical protein [Streptomyces corallincola]
MIRPAPATSLVPRPRRPPDGASGGAPGGSAVAREWYEEGLGWPTAPGRPLGLLTGVRFDVLDVPAGAGTAALRHLRPGSPVALVAGRMCVLVAPGGAEELPGLLEWLEWAPLEPDVRALGAGGRMTAPAVPVDGAWGAGALPGAGRPQGAAVWLRPPGRERGGESSLPGLPTVGVRGGGAPDLVRLVDTVALWCHRVRLGRAGGGPPACRGDQPLAFS